MFRCSHTIFRELIYPCLLKLHFVKIINYGTSVCDEISGDAATYNGSVLVDVCGTLRYPPSSQRASSTINLNVIPHICSVFDLGYFRRHCILHATPLSTSLLHTAPILDFSIVIIIIYLTFHRSTNNFKV